MAELSDENPAAEKVVGQLKRIQDAIGDWHDCVTLIETAESAVSTPHSPLLTVLHSRARAKFIEALRITAQAKTELLQMRSNVPSRKQPESIHADGVRDLKYGTR
jgi:CHAD domain-containing protein